ncbi:MAG: MipA/OmpV family protein [Proteobacteria bacterium]|nr:MipA/OmpV family protein [Pseudomonadota bacterium]
MNSLGCVCASAAVALALLPAAARSATFDNVDGALTLIAQRGPDYPGSSDYGQSLRPGFFLRWGRLSVSSGGGWAALRRDAEVRGLGLDLVRSEQLRLSLGLRVDSGRDEDSSAALAGMGDVKRTVRVRLGATWSFAPDWQVGAAWTVDAFNRGGGNLLETKLEHDWKLSPRLNLTTGATLNAGGPRYMQTYFGVDPEQAARTGYPTYEPGSGLRDAQVYATLRAELGEDWVGLFGLGFSRLLDGAADSPLTRRRNAYTVTTGVGWRF